MDYSNEAWVVALIADTPGWRSLSLGARSLYLELTRKLGRFKEEASLGPKGLEAVAALVSAPWSEVEPYLNELIEDGRVFHDAEGRVLRAPGHLRRQAESKDYWVKLYIRDTGGWLALPLRARGLSLEITRRMGRHADEISLGAAGQKAIASLVNAPWDEVRPLLTKLRAAGRIVYDRERQTLRDPQHLERQHAKSSGRQRKRDHDDKRRVTRGNAEERAVTRRNDHKEQSHQTEHKGPRAARGTPTPLKLELAKATPRHGEVIAAYREAFAARYGQPPDTTRPRVGRAAKDLLAAVGDDVTKAVDVVRAGIAAGERELHYIVSDMNKYLVPKARGQPSGSAGRTSRFAMGGQRGVVADACEEAF